MKEVIDDLRFSGWYAPFAEDELIKRFSESGLNYLFLLRDDGYTNMNIDVTEKYLSLCDKYGVKVYIRRDKHYTIPQVAEISKTYKMHDSFKGYCIYDEPKLSEMEKFGNEVGEYEKYFSGYDFFINLFPSYASEKCVGKSWKNYIREYIDKIYSKINSGEKWLSFDFYPICFSYECGNFLAEHWLNNTQVMADYADEIGAKLNVFIQAMPFSGTEERRGFRDRTLTFNDMMLQDYTNLAFGAEMLSYFCYDTPTINFEFLKRHNAMIDRAGEPTDIYYYVKKLNGQIRDFSARYIHYKRIDTYCCSKENYYMFDNMEKREISPEISERMDFEFNGNLLLGCFRCGDNLALIPVNFGEITCINAEDLKIIFKNPEKVRISQQGITKELKVSDKLTIHLEAGEGCFIEILK